MSENPYRATTEATAARPKHGPLFHARPYLWLTFIVLCVWVGLFVLLFSLGQATVSDGQIWFRPTYQEVVVGDEFAIYDQMFYVRLTGVLVLIAASLVAANLLLLGIRASIRAIGR